MMTLRWKQRVVGVSFILISTMIPMVLMAETGEWDGVQNEGQAVDPTVSDAVKEQLNENPVVLDRVVVTASALDMSVSSVASSITVITADMIEARKAQSLEEILQGVAGVDLAQNGGAGQLGSLFMRGAASERTLVLINGLPLNDPMSPSRNTDVSRISLDNVEQIEIVRGPQSVVFGGGAMGGVVNIITRKEAGRPATGFTLEGGKYGSWLGKLQASGAFAGLQASLGASMEGTESFSAAKRSDDFTAASPVPDVENDPYRNLTLDLNLGYHALPGWEFNLSNRFSRSMSEIDTYGGNGGDDPNFISWYTQSAYRLDARWHVLPDLWQTRISAGVSQLDRVANDDVDEDHPIDMTRSEYRSRTIQFNWNNQLALLAWNRMAIGVDYRQEQGMSNYVSEYLDWYTFAPVTSQNGFSVRSTHTTGVYVEDQVAWQGWMLNAGVRYDQHDQYGGATTFRITPSYQLMDWGTRVKGTYGTAFNAPSLNQLYVSDIYSKGDPELEPETSKGWDAGIEQALWNERIKLGATYFQTNYENQIDAPYEVSIQRYVYLNLGESETKGWEVDLTAEPLTDLQIRIAYTKLTANDLTNQDTIGPEPLIHRADYQLSADMLYTYQDLSATLHVSHVGPRWDTGKIRLEPYTLVDLVLCYQVVPQVQTYVKLKNLLDEDYTLVTGYTTARFAAYAGVKIDLL